MAPTCNATREVDLSTLSRQATPDSKQPIRETREEMQKEYLPGLYRVVEKHKDWDFPFYIVVRDEKDRLLQNVIKQKMWARRTRPTPEWDLTLWHYDPKSDELRYEWTVPSRFACEHIRQNRDLLPPDYNQLIYFVDQFYSGKLA